MRNLSSIVFDSFRAPSPTGLNDGILPLELFIHFVMALIVFSNIILTHVLFFFLFHFKICCLNNKQVFFINYCASQLFCHHREKTGNKQMCHLQYTVDSVSNYGNKQAYKDGCICLSAQNLSNKASIWLSWMRLCNWNERSAIYGVGKWHLEMLHSTTCLYMVQMSGEYSTTLFTNVENIISVP